MRYTLTTNPQEDRWHQWAATGRIPFNSNGQIMEYPALQSPIPSRNTSQATTCRRRPIPPPPLPQVDYSYECPRNHEWVLYQNRGGDRGRRAGPPALQDPARDHPDEARRSRSVWLNTHQSSLPAAGPSRPAAETQATARGPTPSGHIVQEAGHRNS